MARTNRPLTSREYKLMLNPDRFTDWGGGIAAFHDLLAFLFKRLEVEDVDRKDVSEERRTWYVDTAGHALRNAGFVLRVREELGKDEPFKVTMKHRGPDRYIAAAHGIDGDGSDSKFEEDILPPFISRFSYSRSFRYQETPSFGNLGGVREVFAGLPELEASNRTPVERVNGFKATEITYELCKFKPAGGTKVKAGLGFWYLPEVQTGPPLVGEFAMSYKAQPNGDEHELEQFTPETVEACRNLFRAIQQQANWFSLGMTTKTAFAYDFG